MLALGMNRNVLVIEQPQAGKGWGKCVEYVPKGKGAGRWEKGTVRVEKKLVSVCETEGSVMVPSK